MTIFHRSTQTSPQAMRGVFVNYRMNAGQLPLAIASVALSTGRYTISSSGDGNLLGNTSGNVFTSNSLASNALNHQEVSGPNSPKIARSVFNDLSHLTLTHTASGGALSFQTISGGPLSANLRIKWSPGGFNGASSNATLVPLATNGAPDEALLWGAGSDASPGGTPVNGDRLNASTRVTIGVSDDPTYPFLYALVWLGPTLATPQPGFFLVWDTLIRSPGQATLDPSDQICGCWSNPTYASYLSPPFLTGAINEGWWARFGASAVVRQFRFSTFFTYSGTVLQGLIGRSAAGRSPRDPSTAERQFVDTTDTGVKGRFRNIELCLRNVGQLQPFDDADNDVRSALYRVGDLLIPFNRFGTNGAAGRLLRP